MESAANIIDSLNTTQVSGAKDKGSSRDSVKESMAASQFYSLFSGNLAKSYQGAEKAGSSDGKAVSGINEAPKPVKVEEVSASEKGFLNNSPENEGKERLKAPDAKESRNSKVETRNNENAKAAQKQGSERAEEVKENQEKKVSEKQQRKADNKVVEIRTKATKTVESSGKTVSVSKTEIASETGKVNKAKAAVKKAQVKGTQKTRQQTEVKNVLSTKVQKNPEVMLDSKSVKSQADAKIQQAPAAAKADAAGAVQPGNEAASTSGEGNSGNSSGNNSQAIPNADSFADKVTKLTGKSFSQVMQETKGVSGKSGANGPQMSPGTASVQYNRRAGEVSFTTKAKGTVKTTPAKIISQIVKAAKVTVNSGTQEMKLLLKPEELGWLKVKITMAEGKMTAHFGVENEAVKGLLENNLSQLQQALNGQNLKVNDINISVNSQSNPDSGLHKGDAEGSGRRRNPLENEIDEEAMEDAMKGMETQLIELSAVNVMI